MGVGCWPSAAALKGRLRAWCAKLLRVEPDDALQGRPSCGLACRALNQSRNTLGAAAWLIQWLLTINPNDMLVPPPDRLDARQRLRKEGQRPGS